MPPLSRVTCHRSPVTVRRPRRLAPVIGRFPFTTPTNVSILRTFDSGARKRDIIAPSRYSMSIFPRQRCRSAPFHRARPRRPALSTRLSEECQIGGAHTWRSWHPCPPGSANTVFIRNSANRLAPLAPLPLGLTPGGRAWAVPVPATAGRGVPGHSGDHGRGTRALPVQPADRVEAVLKTGPRPSPSSNSSSRMCIRANSRGVWSS